MNTRLKASLLLLGCFGFVLCAEADIRVHCRGEGAPLYLVGGGPAFTTWNLQPVQDALSTRYRVCRWDMRGVGDNADLPVAPDRTALSQWLQDMHAVLPDEPVVLWGHSWGALQALLFARQSPQRVRALVLSNPVDPALTSLAHIERKRYNHPDNDSRLRLADMDTAAEALHNLRSKIASYFPDAEQGWAYAAGFGQDDADNVLNIRVWDEYRASPLAAADVKQLAGRIRGILYCRGDVLHPENLEAYRQLLPQVQHRELRGCGHFPWVEQPTPYFDALSGWL